VAEIDDVFYAWTSAGSPNGRVIALPAGAVGRDRWIEVVPERQFALVGASVVGRRIIAQYLRDAYSAVQVMDLRGRTLYAVKLPGLGQAYGFVGDAMDDETFFSYTDFLTPPAVSRLEVSTGKVSLFRAPTIAARTSDYVTEQVF